MKKLSLIIIFIINFLGFSAAGINLYNYVNRDYIPGFKTINKNEETIATSEISDKESKPGRIKVNSKPSGVKVFIDGYLKGRTPGEFTIVSVERKKQYLLTLVEPGYIKEQKIININPGQKKIFNIKLTKQGDHEIY